MNLTHSLDYTVVKDESLRVLIDDLAMRGIVQDPESLIFWGELSGVTKRLHPGQYTLRKNMSLSDLFSTLEHPQHYYSVTIIDGWTYAELMEHLAKNPYLNHDLKTLRPVSLMRQLSGHRESAEGAFLPQTYFVTLNSSEMQLLKRAYDAMQKTVDHDWGLRAGGLGVKNKKQAVVLASIVELEAQKAIEMPIIANVFYNRLRKRMRLQSDPTVLYAVHKPYGEHLTRYDLHSTNAFNTYIYKGLPPHAIALPSNQALLAVLHPAHQDYYYFEAKGDGKHTFSKTLHEQQLAITQYRNQHVKVHHD